MSTADRARALAAGFVREYGDPLERLRAGALVGERPAGDAVALLESAQTGEGAFDLPRAGGGVAGTRCALRVLDELRALGDASVERACAYLASRQERDGSWCEGPGAGEESRIACTGTLAGLLGKTRFARPALLDAAGSYLAARWSPERVRGPAWAVLGAYAHFFANVPHELGDEALQWCGRELERGFRSRGLDAVATARVFVDCDAHALPGARIDRAELVAALLVEQAADGGFGAAAHPAARVPPTLDALLALVRLAV